MKYPILTIPFPKHTFLTQKNSYIKIVPKNIKNVKSKKTVCKSEGCLFSVYNCLLDFYKRIKIYKRQKGEGNEEKTKAASTAPPPRIRPSDDRFADRFSRSSDGRGGEAALACDFYVGNFRHCYRAYLASSIQACGDPAMGDPRASFSGFRWPFLSCFSHGGFLALYSSRRSCSFGAYIRAA